MVGVRVGAYVLEVGADCRSFTRFAPKAEDQNAGALAHAFAEDGEQDDLSAPVAALEELDESAAAVTDKIEHAHALFRDVLAGRFDRAFVMREIDGLLGLSERLDRAGRYDEQLRLARALHGLLATMFRWLDLIRTLRRALRSAKAVNDQAGQAWALHELGTLHLSAGHARTAAQRFREALQIERRLDAAGSCATRHNLDCARRAVANDPVGAMGQGPGSRPRGLLRALAVAGVKGVAVLVVSALVVAAAGVLAGVALSQDSEKPEASLGPDPLSFSALTVGKTSAVKTLSVQAGSDPMRVGRITVGNPAEFLVDNHCLSERPAGAICPIDVRFRPSAAGPRASELTVGLAGGVELSVELTGVGIEIVAPRLSSGRVDLGSVRTGATSAGTVTVSAGSAALTVSHVTSDAPEFRVSDQCVQPLGAGEICAIGIVFAPTVAGPQVATLTVRLENGRTLATDLVGVGVKTPPPPPPTDEDPPTLTASVALGRVEPGSRSAMHMLTLTAGSKRLAILGIASDSREFEVTHHCGKSLAPLASCAIAVTFSPAVAGLRTATLTVAREGAPALTSTLRGTGSALPEKPDLDEATLTSSLGLGEAEIGERSPAGTVVLTAGSKALTIVRVASDSDEFLVEPFCPPTLPAGQSCSIAVFFAPALAGPRAATLTVRGDGEPALTSDLSGTGVPEAPPRLDGSLQLGEVEIGSRSPAMTLILTAGSKPLTVNRIVSVPAREFHVHHGCARLPARATCSIEVVFEPVEAGARTATLEVTLAARAPLRSQLEGVGLQPPRAVPSAVDFGQVVVQSRKAEVPRLVAGSKPLTILGMRTNDPRQFMVTAPCRGRLDPGASCGIEILFRPLATGTQSAILTISLSERAPLTVALTGEGIEAFIQLDPTALDFGSVDTSSTKGVWLTNTGKAPLAIEAITSSDHHFAVKSACHSVLAPGASCRFFIGFNPGEDGHYGATITIVADGRGQKTLAVSGDRVSPPPPPPSDPR